MNPIVLVGGFTVWGRDAFFGFKYWGGLGRDVQEDLNALGWPTFTAAPGPFSSNWDRAAEVYAILRGGRVDYGEAHARRCGHARFGRSYPGLLADGTARVHLVGHSMGGQTIRVLAHLLAEGAEAERRATPAAELNPLFAGGQDLVLSLTTLMAPHDGSTLTRKRENLTGAARRLLTLAGAAASSAAVYDLMLDHWGLQRDPGEAWNRFRNRVMASPLWQGTGDFSACDLSLEGARELNSWVRLPANVPAFSWSACKTRPGPGGRHAPAPHMNVLWRSGARYMGAPHETPAGGVEVDPTWYPNDGVVNTRSMAGPASEPVQPFDGTPRPGIWNHVGVLDGWDHTEILGLGPGHAAEAMEFHRRWARFLATIRP